MCKLWDCIFTSQVCSTAGHYSPYQHCGSEAHDTCVPLTPASLPDLAPSLERLRGQEYVTVALPENEMSLGS